jgi:hypothetical protein
MEEIWMLGVPIIKYAYVEGGIALTCLGMYYYKLYKEAHKQ